MTKIKIQFVIDGTQQMDAGRRRRRGKYLEEIGTFTLPEPLTINLVLALVAKPISFDFQRYTHFTEGTFRNFVCWITPNIPAFSRPPYSFSMV